MFCLLLHISSSYAKILGETNFQSREIPRSGLKAKDGERKREKETPKVGNNNGQLRIASATSGGAHKATWANYKAKAKSQPPKNQPEVNHFLKNRI